MANPFKWFNDLIERSTFWYYVYFFSLNIICGKFFYSLSDQAFYVVSFIIWIFLGYLAWKTVLKKLKNHIPHFDLCNFLFSLFFIVIAPFFMFYSLKFHPLLGNFIGMIFALIGCYSVGIITHFQNKKQA